MENLRMTSDAVTEGELSILEVIWQQGTPTSRDIAEAVYDLVSDSKMASVQKLLERLEAKGFVRRDRSERAHRFHALVSKEDFLRRRLRALAGRLCGGSLAPLVTALLRSKEFSKRDFKQLHQLIDELWPPEK
jgi:predicted transcriptional regulator